MNKQWVRSHIMRSKWALVLLNLEAFSFISLFYLQKWVIDEVVVNGHYTDLYGLALLYIVSFVIYEITFVSGPMLLHQKASVLKIALSEQVMSVIYRLPMNRFQTDRITNYLLYFTRDIENSTDFIAVDVPRAIQETMKIIVLMFIIGWVSPVILVFSVLFNLLYVGLGIYFKTKMTAVSIEKQNHHSALLVNVEEGISSTREIIAYQRQQWELGRYLQYFRNYYRSVMAEGKLVNKKIMFSEPIKWGGNLTVLLYGGYLVIQQTITLGMFVITYHFASQLIYSFHNLFDFFIKYASSSVFIDRIQTVLAEEQIYDGSLKIDQVKSIQFENVSFAYEQHLVPVLKHISLDIPIGQKVAFVGSSGEGKSTIAKLLIRFIEPNQGTILINDVPLSQMDRESWQRKVSIVFQEPYFFPDTIRNNLKLGHGETSDEKLEEACKSTLIYDFIAQLQDGFDTVIGDRGMTLSGGQRQRLALARAIVQNPDILILDEATSSLDEETERVIQQKLDSLREGLTTIIIAHRLSTIKNADLIYVIKNGIVLEKGKHEELIECSSFYLRFVSPNKEWSCES